MALGGSQISPTMMVGRIVVERGGRMYLHATIVVSLVTLAHIAISQGGWGEICIPFPHSFQTGPMIMALKLKGRKQGLADCPQRRKERQRS